MAADMRTDIRILALGSFAPGPPLTADELGVAEDPLAKSPLFRLPATRHHLPPNDTAADMVAGAVQSVARLRRSVSEGVDLLMTNTLLPDTPITGCGAAAAHQLGITPSIVLDIHNGGCAAFPYMLSIAQMLMADDSIATALLCTVQNGAGQSYRQRGAMPTTRSASHGDACGVALVGRGAGSPVVWATALQDPASAVDMGLSVRDRRYWEAGEDEFDIVFDEQATERILERGNSLIPAIVRKLCADIGVHVGDIGQLVTNQPSRLFLRNWRRNLGIDEQRHFDTYDRYGNLYGAGILVSLREAAIADRLHHGDLVALAGFAHAGDLAAAAALRWSDDTVVA